MILDVTDEVTGEKIRGKVRRWDIIYGRVICEPIEDGEPDEALSSDAVVHLSHRDGYTDEFMVDVAPLT
jgi:hypothetical protein